LLTLIILLSYLTLFRAKIKYKIRFFKGKTNLPFSYAPTMNKTKQFSALDRYKVIRPFLEKQTTLANLATTNNINVRTLRRWIRQYKADGMKGLERKTRKDKGSHYNLSEVQQQIIEALVLQKPPLSFTAIHRKFVTIAEKKGWTVPSYFVVRDIAHQIDADLLMLAHKGSKEYAQVYELLHRQESGNQNEVWQADHTPLDIALLDEKGQSRKPWLTIIIDDYSRAISGFFLSFEAPSALHTALALRQAIWRKANTKWIVCGIPQVLYTDHGSDFTSKHIETVCADLKIQLVFSTVGKPRGRGKVERFFLSVNQLLLMNLDGYAPPYSKLLKATLTLADFSKLLESFIVEQYHYKVHSTTGQEPLKRWTSNSFLPQLPNSLEQLDLLLLTVPKPRKVRRDGIYFQNFRYIHTTLAGYVGESVVIRYDPRDLAQISVFLNHKFVCPAICQELVGHTISLKEIIKARRSKKRELRQIINRRQVLLSDIFSNRVESAPAKKTSTLKKYENE